MKIATRRALEGAFLGSGAPLGWMAIQWLMGANPLADLAANPALYVYMLVGTMIVFTLYGYHVGAHEQKFEQRAVHDELTGLYNTRHFRKRLHDDLSAAQRLHFPISLILLDLDRFKAVNDRYGHAAGDVVLRSLADLLRDHSRRSDTPARIGGEEFAVILPFTDTPAARALAERMRRALESKNISWSLSRSVSITASFGISEFHPDDGDTAEKLLERADQAMYGAKRQGRNRVVSSEEDGAEPRLVPERRAPAHRAGPLH